MSLDMVYLAGEKKFSFDLESSEVDFLEKFCKGNMRKCLDIIFGVPDLGESESVERNKVLNAISGLLDSIQDAKELSSHFYSFKIEMPPGSGSYITGSGLFSGFRIDGQVCSIEGGLDMCELTKSWQDKSGVVHNDAPIDLRNQKILKTDDFGDIIIRKKKKPSDLIRKLKGLKSFLENLDIDTVKKNHG